MLAKGLTYAEGRCDLSTMVALCTPLPEGPEEAGLWNADQALIRLLLRVIRAADACLQQGDAAGARRCMDR